MGTFDSNPTTKKVKKGAGAILTQQSTHSFIVLSWSTVIDIFVIMEILPFMVTI
jgi:hypothetical protein